MEKKSDAEKKAAEEMISLDELLESTDGSIFSLARIAMLRSTEIYDGSKPLVDHLPLDKSTTIAFKEIAAGKITLGNGQCTEKEKKPEKSKKA